MSGKYLLLILQPSNFKRKTHQKNPPKSEKQKKRKQTTFWSRLGKVTKIPVTTRMTGGSLERIFPIPKVFQAFNPNDGSTQKKNKVLYQMKLQEVLTTIPTLGHGCDGMRDAIMSLDTAAYSHSKMDKTKKAKDTVGRFFLPVDIHNIYTHLYTFLHTVTLFKPSKPWNITSISTGVGICPSV